jgi:ribonuclease VapC
MTVAVDTSAIVAILLAEPEAESFVSVIEAGETAISAGSLMETLRVMMLKRGVAATVEVWTFLETFGIRVRAVDEPQMRLAQDAMRRFGRGRGEPPAVLNFGDLFAYALARHLDVPLLFKGDDFSQTDVRVARIA